jgi:hypothetical protein
MAAYDKRALPTTSDHDPLKQVMSGRDEQRGSASLNLAPKAIADAGLCQNVARLLRIRLDLLPQLLDVDAQILDVRRYLSDLPKDELVGQHFAGVRDK